MASQIQGQFFMDVTNNFHDYEPSTLIPKGLRSQIMRLTLFAARVASCLLTAAIPDINFGCWLKLLPTWCATLACLLNSCALASPF